MPSSFEQDAGGSIPEAEEARIRASTGQFEQRRRLVAGVEDAHGKDTLDQSRGATLRRVYISCGQIAKQLSDVREAAADRTAAGKEARTRPAPLSARLPEPGSRFVSDTFFF